MSQVSKETLLAASRGHISDVVKAMAFFSGKLIEAAGQHDYDKLTAIDWFYSDFKTKFAEHGWWDNHRKIHRHHLGQPDGVPDDVNLLDVLEWIADCVMAGMARAGEVYPLEIPECLLERAFVNTVKLLKSQVVVVELKTIGGVDGDTHEKGTVVSTETSEPERPEICESKSVNL